MSDLYIYLGIEPAGYIFAFSFKFPRRLSPSDARLGLTLDCSQAVIRNQSQFLKNARILRISTSCEITEIPSKVVL